MAPRRLAHQIVEATRLFAGYGLESAYLEVTPASIASGELLAPPPVQSFLKTAGLHDFAWQQPGEIFAVRLPVRFIAGADEFARELTLYRRSSREREAVISTQAVDGFLRPGTLVGLVCRESELYALPLDGALSQMHSDSVLRSAGRLAIELAPPALPPPVKLLSRLQDICAKGVLPSLRLGSTGVGFTLQRALGIENPSSRAPDFEGVEVTTSRIPNKSSPTRVTIFSQVPDWDSSSARSGTELLERFGYLRAGSKRLCCTVGQAPNAQGLSLEVDYNSGLVLLQSAASGTACQWDLTVLQERLLEKHSETFWVQARASRGPDGREHFHYISATHTRAPLASALAPLIASGVVTLDLTLTTLANGRTRDHGYMFKIAPQSLHYLFPLVNTFDLTRDNSQ